MAIAFCGLVGTTGALVAQEQDAGEPRGFETNQDYIENLWGPEGIDIQDIGSVFSYVFSQLPDEVTVYPTENYFYFSFFHNGVQYAGNIRLDTLDRDDGIVHFAYFSSFTRWNEELINQYKKLAFDDGVEVTKLDKLAYRVKHEGKMVTFYLNDLSEERPASGELREDETFIGPVFDESGIRFHLVYSGKLKLFHYILNTDHAVPDILSPGRIFPEIEIGTRTGFAFYNDRIMDRKILIGVYEGNSMVNNYLDGPFDQLPDNFIDGDTLRKSFIDESPELEGKIDRFGNTDGGASRVLITPYIHYGSEYDLAVFAECANEAGEDQDKYYRCFKVSEYRGEVPPAGPVDAPPAEAGPGPEQDQAPAASSK